MTGSMTVTMGNHDSGENMTVQSKPLQPTSRPIALRIPQSSITLNSDTIEHATHIVRTSASIHLYIYCTIQDCDMSGNPGSRGGLGRTFGERESSSSSDEQRRPAVRRRSSSSSQQSSLTATAPALRDLPTPQPQVQPYVQSEMYGSAYEQRQTHQYRYAPTPQMQTYVQSQRYGSTYQQGQPQQYSQPPPTPQQYGQSPPPPQQYGQPLPPQQYGRLLAPQQYRHQAPSAGYGQTSPTEYGQGQGHQQPQPAVAEPAVV
ncbi:hypothetical protein K491DRAFT_223046 [Lophiostoma macrostomum CBS 122681]|uniref:Uncharacterized protein n=1 Tax=Lophiostoma macrostomum CBS 122681 TaxID=1314788 RepID=A0A6A6SM41_9PLEO|nr:hypothetical protein K491DRAFT_223046 [Lophiostoma macrostomum CBS 122681]